MLRKPNVCLAKDVLCVCAAPKLCRWPRSENGNLENTMQFGSLWSTHVKENLSIHVEAYESVKNTMKPETHVFTFVHVWTDSNLKWNFPFGVTSFSLDGVWRLTINHCREYDSLLGVPAKTGFRFVGREIWGIRGRILWTWWDTSVCSAKLGESSIRGHWTPCLNGGTKSCRRHHYHCRDDPSVSTQLLFSKLYISTNTLQAPCRKKKLWRNNKIRITTTFLHEPWPQLRFSFGPLFWGTISVSRTAFSVFVRATEKPHVQWQKRGIFSNTSSAVVCTWFYHQMKNIISFLCHCLTHDVCLRIFFQEAQDHIFIRKLTYVFMGNYFPTKAWH